MASKRTPPNERELAALAKHRRNGPPAPAGNTHSLKHGTRSERMLAPVRERHTAELRQSYPELDDRRLALLADRLASVELAARWLDAQGTPVRTKSGQVFEVADRLAKWNAAAWKMLSDVERERRESRSRPHAVGDFARWAAEQTAAEDAHVVESDDQEPGA